MILTGAKGYGKTTLLKALFPDPVPGLTTWAVPRQGVYLQETDSGRQGQIGYFDAALPGPGNQMALLSEGFDALGVPALGRCMASSSPWITIDEIGYLESAHLPYREALAALLEKKQVAATVRKQDLPFLQGLCRREDAFVVDLDQPFGNIGCVIMASGLGKRFGGNKLMADFHGGPLICRILDATAGIFSQRVVVTRSEEVAALCRAQGVQTIFHSLPHRSDTVRLGLEAMPGIERCLFATADQPLLRWETVAALALSSKNDPDRIWRTVFRDTPGSPVVFPQWAFPELKNLPEGKGGGVVINKYPERLRMVNVRDMYELKDVDSPEDLLELAEQ